MTEATAVDVRVTQGPTQTVTVRTAPSTSVIVGEPAVVNTVSTSVEKVSVTQLGVVGPPGPPGVGGGAPLVYPLVNVSSWLQEHNLGYLPEVRVVDADGNIVGMSVAYPSAATVYLLFPTPFTGEVLLS